MFYLKESAFQNYVNTYRMDVTDRNDPIKLMSDIKQDVFNLIKTITISLRIRFIICMSLLFSKVNNENGLEFHTFYFCSKTERVLSQYQINEKIQKAFQKISNSIEDFLSHGSGWIIHNINYVDIHIGHYSDRKGGCKSVNLPTKLKNKKALLHIYCEKNMCFIFCILAALFPQKANKNKESSYKKYMKYLKFQHLNFPVKISDIKKFEKRNNVTVNVFSFETDIYPIYISKFKSSKEIHLLLHKKHYFLITNLNRLLHYKKGVYKYCKNCLLGFQRESTLIEHQKRCLQNSPRKVTLPSGDNKYLKFNGFSKMMVHPFCLYCDFECFIQKMNSVEPSPNISYNIQTQQHEPFSYGLILVDDNSKIIYHKFYCGTDVVENFLRTLKSIAKCIMTYMKRDLSMLKDNRIFPNNCHLCGKQFTSKDIIAINHNHITGEKLGKSCISCNLNYKRSYYVPIVLHNLSGYDSHLILKKISHLYGRKINIIPVNSEKYTTFSIDNLKFMDSYLFLPSKLSDLINQLKISKFNFPIFNSFFFNHKHRHLLLRKGVFPYSYFDSFSRLEENKLPLKNGVF